MTILVTGATGNLGRLVVEHLHSTGHPVRALTRDASAAGAGAARLPDGVEIVEGDLTKPDTLAAALDGVSALHLLGATGHDHTPLTTGPEILALATEAGVQRLTVLAVGDDESGLTTAVRTSPLEWTFVWPIDLMSNTLGWADTIRTTSEVREPYAARRTASADERDVAEVIAAVLTSTNGSHAGRSLHLTGPEALTPAAKVAAIAAATGQELRFTELTDDQAREQWRAEGWPDEGIDFMLHMWATVPASVADTTSAVEDVLGRPPRPFAAWAADHAAAFRP
ncbi:NAD(P)H-binding protein [Streptomyces sp. NBC_00237]|uniref:NmrA family NAD(P)-binding protein n=1 Tax=Streptomyces sp. NBC_00237 TaxID=2975687 RepID=UPI0022518975|nr:NmrA family NAD(P)-binding protein [Streptomyces sp. NBC_00237]MCX5200548.1 NAD(P)H-binding protein [Streptomyces sp. NBC_00237]